MIRQSKPDNESKKSRSAAVHVRKNSQVAFQLKLHSPFSKAIEAISSVSRVSDSNQPVIQYVLKGDYANAIGTVATYFGKSEVEKWEQRFQEAQDAGFKAPNLAGHGSSKSGKDGKGESERQKQNKAILSVWWAAYTLWKSKRKDDDSDDGASGSAAAASSGKTSESNREERRQERADEKKKQYDDSQKQPDYVPPWLGGPSPWHK